MAFEIVEKTFDAGARFIAAPRVRLRQGYIGQLKDIDGDIVCDISNGEHPLGIIGNGIYCSSELLSYDISDMVELWTMRMVFRTSICVPDSYDTGDALYTGTNGLLTRKCPFENAQIVARVITGQKKNWRIYEALWL